jgi:uncharacterized protein (TIGR02145 family)
MKKHILFLGILMVIFGLRLNAQTLKNIHRQNLPVLQIPIDLIDKVETVDVTGQKYLHVTQFNGYVNEVPVAQIDSITHSEGQALDPAQLGNLRTASVMGIVRGPTGAPEMNAIVRSPYGGEETRTDPNGVFFLNDIVVYDKLGYITIIKPGFHQSSRSFLPLETGSNRVNIQLLPMTQSGSFSASTGGTVTSGLLQLNFPANAIQLNGQPYTGTVNVYSTALDPSSPEMFDQMPGELLGGMNDSLRLLRSFGMAAVELRDANMNELQVAEGSSATLTFNIPSALQPDAPETIDWWSFDETQGYWKHEGQAQKQGSAYVGAASHFSWWNCDVPENFNDFHGTVNTLNGAPISDALIIAVSQTMGSGYSYTNSEGEFNGRVPKNQLLTLNINLTCQTTNDWALAHTEIIVSENDSISGSYSAELNNFYPITGTVVNCEDQPVESGYVKMGSQIFLTENGDFTIQTCQIGEYSIRGYDLSNQDSIKESEDLLVQVDSSGATMNNIWACNESSGIIADIDNNIYPTVIIGNQIWMAENLKTSRFQDGSIIPNVLVDSTWSQLSTPAWCNYNNNQAYGDIYGKLYNWYTVSDSRNVCPVGWHIPTDNDITVLINYVVDLQVDSVAGGKLKSSGTQFWLSPNLYATNQSGFSGLPGGFRLGSSGFFNNVRSTGQWWSSTESTTSNAWGLFLSHQFGSASRSNSNKRLGLSVRCLKD